ncbi:MAG: prenyltransferase, partial [Candidatus Kariarchaeaceae archaeon]
MKVLVAWEDQGLHTMIGEMENDHIGNSVNISEGTKVRVTILKDTHSYEEWLQPELHGRVTSTGIQVEKQPTDVPLSALVQRQVPSAQSYLKIYNQKLAKTVLRASDHGYIQIAIGGLIQEHRVDLDSFEQGKILKLPERSYLGSQLQFLTSIMLRVEFQDLQYYFEMSLQFGENILLIPMKFSYGRQSPLETHQFGTVHPVTEGIRKSMKFVKYWFLALRAPQYLITFLSIIVGTALTEGQINFSYFLLIVLGTFLVQSGGNLLNDYLDFRSELDELDIIQDQKTISRRFLRDRLLHPQIAISTGGMMFIVGLIIGIYLNTITPGNIVLLLG